MEGLITKTERAKKNIILNFIPIYYHLCLGGGGGGSRNTHNIMAEVSIVTMCACSTEALSWYFVVCAPRYSTVGDKRVIVSLSSQPSVGGVTVSIVAFQAVDPGSTPGQRRNFFLFFFSSIWVELTVKYTMILLFNFMLFSLSI